MTAPIPLGELIRTAAHEGLIVAQEPSQCRRILQDRTELFERQVAQLSRLIREHQSKIGDLRSKLRNRDSRIEAQQQTIAELREELKQTVKRDKGHEKQIASLRADVAERDLKISAQESRIAELTTETAAAQRALDSIKLRAHDWLELRERLGRGEMRMTAQGYESPRRRKHERTRTESSSPR